MNSPEPIRLSKRLSELGLASRREADEWIEKGWVKVDGKVAILGLKVLPHQKIDIDERARRQQARSYTVLLNKPVGYVSGQAEDGYQPAVVLVTPENLWQVPAARSASPSPHHGPVRRQDLFGLAPAGRLDIDSTGLLVLTQDGRIAKQLIGEDSEVEKEYLVRVKYLKPGRLPAEDLERLNHGLSLDGKALKPAKVRWMNDDQLCFVLREGRKRQIRRMCEAVGLHVLALKRVRIGRVMLGDLPVGKWRFLATGERFIDWKTEKAQTEAADAAEALATQQTIDTVADTPAATADDPIAPASHATPASPPSSATPATPAGERRKTLTAAKPYAPRTFRARVPKR